MQLIRLGSTWEVRAPAKLNLFLELLARRDDGYHEIETLMVAINIFDTLYVSANSEGLLRLTCNWASGREAQAVARQSRDVGSPEGGHALGDLPEGTGNIVLRAIERLRFRAGVQSGLSVRLVKRIPSAAGLGGASSDAAAALLAANEVWRLGWSLERLSQVAAELGSDIPFFFGSGWFGSGAAVCRGRGERIEPVAGLPRMHFVVVRPPAGLSTPQVYKHCVVPQRPMSVQPLLEAARAGNVPAVGRCLTNRLQAAAERLSPWIERLQQEFQRLDCLGHQMSGSGTSYFGVCYHARHARRVAGRLRARGIGGVYCASTAAAPHHHKQDRVALEANTA
jgi:4-diphosphocytidyl-2-C-methyl-D-erythritol kinase